MGSQKVMGSQIPPRLSGTKFCVFGLGDSTYSQFCVAAASFDARIHSSSEGRQQESEGREAELVTADDC